MTTNQRDCKIVEIPIEAYTTNLPLTYDLCNPCPLDTPPTGSIAWQAFAIDSQPVKVVLAGLHMMHIVASDVLAACLCVNVKRIVRCRNCEKGCGTDEFTIDLGQVQTGHVFATGDYEVTVLPQLNLGNIPPQGDVKLSLVFEPIIDEHIMANLYNKC